MIKTVKLKALPYIFVLLFCASITARESSFVFGARAEISQGCVGRSLGGALEFGKLFDNINLYLTGEFGGGNNFLGGFANVGYYIAGTYVDNVSNIVGLSMGFRNTTAVADVMFMDSIITQKNHNRNRSHIGIFWKLLFGGDMRFEIMNRFAIGPRTRYIHQFEVIDGNITEDMTVGTQNVLNFTYSLGFGVLLPRLGAQRNGQRTAED